jgi:hypothetical protein
MSKFRTLTSISGREFQVRPNFSLKTFTIKTNSTVYRTYKLPKQEFNELLFNNGTDWSSFLKKFDNYFVVK